MKRSIINKEIRNAIKTFEKIGFKLPPFAFWSPEDWSNKGMETIEILDNMLGWDVTDYGCGEFNKQGLLLFTIRNGNYHKKEYTKTYAEKLMLSKEGQVAPMHFHWKKKEDIINRGGGNLILELYKSTPEETLSNTLFSVSIDGIRTPITNDHKVRLLPGESIFLEPFVYHKFYSEPGTGSVVIGEVSEVNDDTNDNRFLDPLGRFPAIEEDEIPTQLLCNEYKKWINLP